MGQWRVKVTFGKQEKEKKEGGSNYLVHSAIAVIVLLVVKLIWPSLIPYGAFELWAPKGHIADWLIAGLPMLLWGVGLTAAVSFLTSNKASVNREAEEHMAVGLVVSVWAGVVEEICFRWLLFLAAIPILLVINVFPFFGLLGLFQEYVACPIANFVTLGALEAQLHHPETWAVGAALLASNAAFRDGHKYQGIFGLVNSWFLGMFLFWLMFSHGLLCAILIHFLYDLLIFFVRYIDMVIERARGNC